MFAYLLSVKLQRNSMKGGFMIQGTGAVLRLRFILVLMVMCGFCQAVSADEIILDNGDRITGTVVKGEGGKLIIETGYSDPVSIDISRIENIRTDGKLDVHLVTGEILKGPVRTNDSGQVVVESTGDRSAATFTWDRVAAVNPPPVLPARWKGNFNVGASFQTGNAERTNIALGAEAARRTEQDRFALRFLHNYAEEESSVTARSYFGAGKYDYFFTERYYAYLAAELLKDKTKDLNLRTVVGPGVGYQFWDDAVTSLSVEAGIAYFSEDLKTGTDKDWITARLAGDYRRVLREGVVFTDLLVIYPSLERARDYKLRNEAVITTSLTDGLSLRIANILDHDGNPPEDVKRNDWYWIVGVQYIFE
jgi:putative salt-induced outer membrane protein YdiY